MLEDKSSKIRIKAAEGLARVGGRPAVIILRKGLGDKVKEVRIAVVVEDLGFIGGRVPLTVLSEALKDGAQGANSTLWRPSRMSLR